MVPLDYYVGKQVLLANTKRPGAPRGLCVMGRTFPRISSLMGTLILACRLALPFTP